MLSDTFDHAYVPEGKILRITDWMIQEVKTSAGFSCCDKIAALKQLYEQYFVGNFDVAQLSKTHKTFR